MELAEIPESDRAQHLDLLLIADESADMIERYLHRGDLLALIEDDEARALCVVTQEEPDVFEIKNIVTVPEHRRKGYGRRLIALVAERYRDRGGWLLVGTGDVPGILRFYERCGFERSHVVENFFVDNYDHPMYEEGHKLMDMVYLKMRL